MDAVFLADRFAQLGLAAIYFAGIILAIVFWPRHPKQSMFLSLAAGLMLAMELVHIAIWLAPEDPLLDDDEYSILSMADSVIRAVAFGLLMAAAFSGRRPKSYGDFDDGPLG